ncbi:MAG: hypothetical protein ACP6IU_03440 [Candidatus Asgardarchaeia archaeon]
MALELPLEFIKWSFEERRELIKRMIEGKATKEDFLVGFLRHTPAIISHGPAGLNASIKGIGFVVKEEYLSKTINAFKEFLKRKSTMQEAAELLLKYVYTEDYINRIDFNLLSTIELARKHTWTNFQANNDATILFYMPPETTYEVRCKVTIHTEGPYWEYVNLVHDVFHVGPYTTSQRDWKKTPVYIFKIMEIYDNNPKLMGKLIYKREK